MGYGFWAYIHKSTTFGPHWLDFEGLSSQIAFHEPLITTSIGPEAELQASGEHPRPPSTAAFWRMCQQAVIDVTKRLAPLEVRIAEQSFQRLWAHNRQSPMYLYFVWSLIKGMYTVYTCKDCSCKWSPPPPKTTTSYTLSHTAHGLPCKTDLVVQAKHIVNFRTFSDSGYCKVAIMHKIRGE